MCTEDRTAPATASRERTTGSRGNPSAEATFSAQRKSSETPASEATGSPSACRRRSPASRYVKVAAVTLGKCAAAKEAMTLLSRPPERHTTNRQFLNTEASQKNARSRIVRVPAAKSAMLRLGSAAMLDTSE